MAISEPVTTLTDYLLAGVAAALAWRMGRAGRRERSASLGLWSASFAVAALGAALGGTRHGFAHAMAPTAQRALWLGTVYAIGVAGFLMLAGSAVAAARGAARRLLIAAGAVKLAGYLVWVAAHRHYLWVALDSLAGSAAVLALLAREARRGRFAGLGRVLLGLGTGLGGAALRQTGFDPHPAFGHDDLYHVVQMVSLWWLHEGALELRDRPAAPRGTTGQG